MQGEHKKCNRVQQGREETELCSSIEGSIFSYSNQKIADVEEGTTSMVFEGILYPNDKVIIYDLNEWKPIRKRAGRKKKAKKEATEKETVEAAEQFICKIKQKILKNLCKYSCQNR